MLVCARVCVHCLVGPVAQAETLAVEDVGGDDSDDWADSSDEEGDAIGTCPEPEADALDSMF